MRISLSAGDGRMSSRNLRIGVFGATGAVGREMIKVLADRNFPVSGLSLYASKKSAGKTLRLYQGEIVLEESGKGVQSGSIGDIYKTGIMIQDANNSNGSALDIAMLAIGSKWSLANAEALSNGCIVIDNSSAFRYDDNVPLVIPEINPCAIRGSRLIANPNCTTAIAALPLWQLHQQFGGLERVSIATYQAASGAGNNGTTELREGTLAALEGEEYEYTTFQHPLAFNVIPHIDEFQENGYTREEMKVVWEIRKIFGDDSPRISCTCVRVPVERVHSEDISVETKDPFTLEQVAEFFESTPGIEVRDNPSINIYPMPLTATGKYDVEVGRMRRDLASQDPERSLKFWVSGDQLLKGAALNSVQIAEVIAETYRQQI